MLAAGTYSPLEGIITLLVALIGLAGVLSTRGTKKAVREVHDEVRTNNGKRAGEYIEDGSVRIEALEGYVHQMHHDTKNSIAKLVMLQHLHADDPLAHVPTPQR